MRTTFDREMFASAHFTRVSRSLIERSMELRCQAYLSHAKHRLLLQTIMDIEDTKHLIESNQQLKELDRVKTLFIAGLTHELNNPLSAIIGYTELVMMGAGGPLTDKQQNYMKNVVNSAEHLKAIVADALDITKIESNAMETDCSTFPLQQALDEAVSQLAPQADEKGIEIHQATANDIHLYSDKRRLVQCLVNLISNAIKYTDKGSVTLTATMQKNQVVITIADTGIGMSEEDQKDLFKAFRRSRAAKISKVHGTGIGLFLTHKLIHTILHGDITVESELTKGSRFTITLPASTTP